jgi:ElaB/YqjD/DUF883 family membrane-anchored ribosome-binding protein
MSNPDKEVISGRVPADTYDDFEEYRTERDISKSDAVRRLVSKGLDRVQEEKQGEREDARTQTAAEEWCREKAESWAGVGILSAVGVAFLFLVFMVNHFFLSGIPDWPISLALFIFLVGFVMFTGGAVVAAVALRTGFARDFSQRGEDTSEANA